VGVRRPPATHSSNEASSDVSTRREQIPVMAVMLVVKGAFHSARGFTSDSQTLNTKAYPIRYYREGWERCVQGSIG